MGDKDQHHSLQQKAAFWSKIVAHCPGVEAIFLSGSLAQGRATLNSDIDFFILATPCRIWTTRFWVFLLLKMTGNLAKPANHKGRICPNHFITVDHLEIEDKNAYSANLFSHNQPLYDPKNHYQAFVLANSWVSDFGEQFPVQVVKNQDKSTMKGVKLTKNWSEKWLEKIQRRKIQKNPEFSQPDAKIVLSDQELRFHPQPRSKHWKKKESNSIELEINNPYSQ